MDRGHVLLALVELKMCSVLEITGHVRLDVRDCASFTERKLSRFLKRIF